MSGSRLGAVAHLFRFHNHLHGTFGLANDMDLSNFSACTELLVHLWALLKMTGELRTLRIVNYDSKVGSLLVAAIGSSYFRHECGRIYL
jgi:hypothetical protein